MAISVSNADLAAAVQRLLSGRCSRAVTARTFVRGCANCHTELIYRGQAHGFKVWECPRCFLPHIEAGMPCPIEWPGVVAPPEAKAETPKTEAAKRPNVETSKSRNVKTSKAES